MLLVTVGVFPDTVAYVELRQRTAALVMLGAIGVAVLAFVTLGFSRLALGFDVARVLAAPFFALTLALSVLAFFLAVLVKLSVVSLGGEESAP
jgi:hypothetical protein